MTASQILSVQTKCHRDLDVASASRRSELVLGWLWRLKPVAQRLSVLQRVLPREGLWEL